MIGRVSSPRFVGRREELAALGAALQAAGAGNGSAVLIGAEAGMGKSRLVGELAAGARDAGATVIVGECLPLGEGELPYAPIVGALRALARERGTETLSRGVTDELARLLPELAPGATGGAVAEGSQARLFEQLLAVLVTAARDAPLVLVVEDLHWSDRSTRDFLAFLVRAARHERLALIVTYRSDELERRHPTRSFLIELERSGQAARIGLTPFGRDEIGEQAAAILATEPPRVLLDRLVARAEGNPFFAEELLASAEPVGGGLPESLRDALLLRVERLSAAVQALLRITAAAGREIDHPLLETVAGIPQAELILALREAVDSHVLVSGPAGRGYAFRHALLREAVYGDLLPGERRALHLTIARGLQDRPELSSSEMTAAAELAHHFFEAGELSDALAGSLEAASLAEAVYASSEALAQYERALSLWDRVQPDEERVPVVRRAAVVADLAGFSDRAIELARETLARVDPEDAVSLAHAHERLGRFLWSGGLGEDALAEYARAVELVPAEPTLDRAVVVAAEGQVLMLSGRPDESESRCQEALQIARALGADLVEAHVLNTQCPNFSARGNFDASVAASREALQIARGLGSVEEMGRAYTNGSHALDEAGRVADSIALSREGVRAAGELGAVRQFGEFLLAELANRLIRTACWDEAEAILGDIVQRGASGVNAGNIHVSRMQLQLGRGDLEAARSLDEAESHVSRSGSPMWAGPLAVGRVELELLAGRPAAASAAAARGVETIRRSGFVFLTARVYEVGARACAEVVAAAPGDDAVSKRESARARELLDGLDRAIARVAGTPPPLALAARATCAAECSRIDGADPDAWEAAQRQWEAIGDSYLAAYARLRRAEALLLAGADRAAAVTHVAEALAVANELRARPLREQLEALARRARLPLAAAVPTGSAAEGGDRLARFDLTPRELEVFALVGEGLTNREIAGELFISPKTASVHVSRILAKLSVTNRAGAAAAAQRLGVVRVAGE